MTTSLDSRVSTMASPITTGSLADRYYDLLRLDTSALDAEQHQLLLDELELPDAVRYPATLARLRAWLELDGDDVRVLAASWERAAAYLSHDQRMRLREAERSVLMNSLTFDEFRALVAVLPWVEEEFNVRELIAA